MNTNIRSENNAGRADLNDQLAIAIRYRDLGFSLLPIRADGSKAPVLMAWKDLQTRLPTDSEIKTWFGRGTYTGIAIVGGAVSGNLERLDFDEIGLYERWRELCVDLDLEALVAFTVVVKTPTGGYHVYYRCAEPVPGNRPLARRQVQAAPGSGPPERNHTPTTRVETLAETRGEGGYTIAPGSPIECHSLNRPYTLVQGSFETMPTFTRAERNSLVRMVEAFNEYTEPASIYNGPPRQPTMLRRPGDDFNERGDIGPILARSGWTLCRTRGEVQLWRRPGKAGPGISATANWDHRGRFHNFSTNGHPFEADRSYSPFAVKALLDHAGDFTAAAKELAEQGYGEVVPNFGLQPPAPPQIIGAGSSDHSLTPPLLGAGEPSSAGGRTLVIIDACDIRESPEELPTLCGPYVLPGAIHLLFGTRGIGKSTLIFGLAAAIAKGEPWHGVETTQTNVLYMDLESGTVLQALKVARLLPGGIEPGRLYFLSSRLRFPDELVELVQVCRDMRVGLVIFDTLRRCFAVRDENDNAEFYARVAPVIDLLKLHEIASILIAHPPKGMANSARGAGAQEDAVDVVMSLTMHQGAIMDANGTIALSVTKHRLLGVGIPPLCLRRVGDDRFERISDFTPGEDAPLQPGRLLQCQAAIVRSMERLDCEPVTYGALQRLLENQGFPRGTFKTAMVHMKNNDAIDRRPEGYCLADVFGPGNAYLDQLYNLATRMYDLD